MAFDKSKYLSPRSTVPGVSLVDKPTKAVEQKVFDLLRSHEFTDRFQMYIDDTPNLLSGLRGLHLNKENANDFYPHGISFDISKTQYWEIGMDYLVRDFILAFDHSAGANTGYDILRFSRAADDTVVNSLSTKCILSYHAGSPAAFTSFFTIEAGDGLGGVNLSVNNSSTGRNALTVTQRAANAYVAFSCDNILRFGSDWLKTNVASFFIRDDNAAKLRLYMDENGHFYFGNGTAPTAVIHLPAGTATAGTAPLKLTSGTNLTTAEDGVFEYDGAALYYTIGSTRYTLAPTAAAATVLLAAVSTKTANYTLASTDGTILGDATLGGFTLTLPTAAAITGRIYIIKKIDSSANLVTIATTGGQTIDGGATAPLSIPQTALALQSDGSNWEIV